MAEARGLQLRQRARSPGLRLAPARPFELLPVTAQAFCSCASHQEKSYFQCFFCLSGLVGPVGCPAVARGSPRPRPQTAPGSAGEGNAAQEAPGRAGRKARGAQEQHAGRARGQGGGSAGLEKARRGREGRVHSERVPRAAAGLSERWGPPLPARAVCSELGPARCDCGIRRKEPCSSAGVVFGKEIK